ncbi:ras-related RABC2a-like [Olea europaea subsp. europaea]|uniref:Ras-related RABC2a-like n=1 Tax=Olea europaea subsp. europaea TaxID=158383 RepID=A0A8S0UCE6_OLEEU|nr:ras-related RABC2a-like [Olea europaea subsp. europaea]
MGSSKNCCSSINYDYSFKILLIGDSGVGKSSLLLSFISNCQQFPQNLSPTVGVDFKIKLLTTGGKRLKLTIWDTAGQERFGTLMSSYYRGTHGIILVYDVTRRETFTNLLKIWAKELELYSTNPDCVKILVGNKVDKDGERAVTVEEGMALAQKHKCLFLECSSRTTENVQQLFKELTMKILETPSLLEKGSTPVKNQILKQKQVCHEQHNRPLINATTNYVVHVNVFNNLDEPLLITCSVEYHTFRFSGMAYNRDLIHGRTEFLAQTVQLKPGVTGLVYLH